MAYTFDGENKLIILSLGTTTVSVPDMYSRWKDWVLESDNSKWVLAFTSVGGDDIDLSAGTKIPPYIFLQNGWRLRPQEATHTLNVIDGVLLVDGGGDPFVDTIGNYKVRVNYQQPVQAIAYSSAGGGGLTVDQVREAVWNATMSSFNLAGSMGYAQNTIIASMDLIQTLLKYQANRTRVDQTAKTLTVYDDDGLTPIKVFDLKNFAGAASVTEVAERAPQ